MTEYTESLFPVETREIVAQQFQIFSVAALQEPAQLPYLISTINQPQFAERKVPQLTAGRCLESEDVLLRAGVAYLLAVKIQAYDPEFGREVVQRVKANGISVNHIEVLSLVRGSYEAGELAGLDYLGYWLWSNRQRKAAKPKLVHDNQGEMTFVMPSTVQR